MSETCYVLDSRKTYPCLRCGSPAFLLKISPKVYCSLRCRHLDKQREKIEAQRAKKAIKKLPKVVSRETEARNKAKGFSPITSGMTGAINELIVSTDLLRRGVHVFRALSPSCPCDLIALHESKLIRVEVTQGYRNKKGKIGWAVHNETRYDVLAAVLNKTEIAYFPDIFPDYCTKSPVETA